MGAIIPESKKTADGVLSCRRLSMGEDAVGRQLVEAHKITTQRTGSPIDSDLL